MTGFMMMQFGSWSNPKNVNSIPQKSPRKSGLFLYRKLLYFCFMTKQQRFNERNKQVRKLFYDLQDKNKKWRIDAVIEEVANKMFLASRTVEAIIKYEGIYSDTPPPQKTQYQLF